MAFLLFVLIFVEGYIVLASELIAIRLIVPWVGSGTEVISIIIAAVLMPLAFGYYFGGQYRNMMRKKGFQYSSIRKKLVFNLKWAAVFLSLGLSYIVLDVFFIGLYNLGLVNRLAQTVLYAGVFIVYPVFLLGQTIPLVSNYFSREKLSEMTGKMLMFSTLGSFFGSILSTVVLMSFIGVHNTVIFVVALLCLLVLFVGKRKDYESILLAIFIMVLTIYLNNDGQMKNLKIVSNNAYNTIQILPVLGRDDAISMAMNKNYSSSYKEGEGSVYNYIKYINNTFIYPLGKPEKAKSILVIGAAGFTLGLDDKYNNYIFVDIDPDLKRIAEEDFLKRKLSDNKLFIPIAARGFLTQSKQAGKKFDLIILDTFKAGFSMPEHLLTKEYFEQVKSVLKPNGFVVINTVSAAHFQGKFSRSLDNTIRSVFPHVTRSTMDGLSDYYNAWYPPKNRQGFYTTNAVYSYYNDPDPDADQDNSIYTDNKNTYFLDK